MLLPLAKVLTGMALSSSQAWLRIKAVGSTEAITSKKVVMSLGLILEPPLVLFLTIFIPSNHALEEARVAAESLEWEEAVVQLGPKS